VLRASGIVAAKMTPHMIRDVSDTAYWIASHRATESARSDALFRDPLASRLAGERGDRIAKGMPAAHMTSWSVVVRTVIIDEFIEKAIQEGVKTVLNLGAGLDTRPYRMALPASLKWVEVDFPGVITFKQEQLRDEKPRCQLERVALDLSNDKARREFFAKINSQPGKILVLTEGVIPYLSEAHVALLADDLAAQSQFHFWIVDYFSHDTKKFRHEVQRKMPNAPFLFWPIDWFGFFKSHGWIPKEIRYLALEGERVKRPIPLPWIPRVILGLLGYLAPRARFIAYKKFAGYVLLERD
jgi:methyltransferase (TIGR00027 family)